MNVEDVVEVLNEIGDKKCNPPSEVVKEVGKVKM